MKSSTSKKGKNFQSGKKQNKSSENLGLQKKIINSVAQHSTVKQIFVVVFAMGVAVFAFVTFKNQSTDSSRDIDERDQAKQQRRQKLLEANATSYSTFGLVDPLVCDTKPSDLVFSSFPSDFGELPEQRSSNGDLMNDNPSHAVFNTLDHVLPDSEA